MMETYTVFYKNCRIKRLTFEDVIKLNNCLIIKKDYYNDNIKKSIILFDEEYKDVDYIGNYKTCYKMYGNIISDNDILIVNKFKDI